MFLVVYNAFAEKGNSTPSQAMETTRALQKALTTYLEGWDHFTLTSTFSAILDDPNPQEVALHILGCFEGIVEAAYQFEGFTNVIHIPVETRGEYLAWYLSHDEPSRIKLAFQFPSWEEMARVYALVASLGMVLNLREKTRQLVGLVEVFKGDTLYLEEGCESLPVLDHVQEILDPYMVKSH
jgi:hypothetical protein